MKNKNIKSWVFRILLIFILLFTICLTSCESGSGDNPKGQEESIEYYVTFNSDGGSQVLMQTILEGGFVQEPTCTKEGYELIGWFAGSHQWDFSKDDVFSDFELKAKWKEILYTVSFDSNGGTGFLDDQTFKPGEEFTIPGTLESISKNGSIFEGWIYQEQVYQPGEKITIEEKEDVTLVASFYATLSIQFDSNGGTGTMDNVTGCKKNTSYTLPSNTFTRENYSFTGWALESNGEVVYDNTASLPLLEDSITLYAIWEDSTDYVQLLIDGIDNLGEITYGSLESISQLIKDYEKLTEENQARVTNINQLTAAAKSVATIYLEVLKNDSYEAINVTDARTAFNLLTVEQQQEMDLYVSLLEAEYMISRKTMLTNIDSNIKDVLVSTAYAYYYQATQIQYDQYNARRNLNASPEDATAAKGIYLDCSSYCNAIYHYAFDINVTPTPNTANFDEYAQKSSSNADVIWAITNANYTTEASQKDILNQVQASLEVGDLLIYRHGASSGSSGHVMFYIGNNQFLHSTGTSTKLTVGTSNPASFTDKTTTVEASKGSIALLEASELFTNTSSSRYLFKKTTSDTVYTFSVLRVLNRTGLELTTQAKNRYLLGQVGIELSNNINPLRSVQAGSEITYTISLVNNNTATTKGIYVTQELPKEVEFVSASENGIYNKNTNTILWDIEDLAAKAKKSITFTVKTKQTLALGTEIIMDNGSVCGVSLNTLRNSICGSRDTSLVVTEAQNKIGSTYESDLDFAKDVYKKAWNVDILTTEAETSNVILKILSYYKVTPTSDPYPYLVKGAYGGIAYYAKNTTDNDCLKLVKLTYLQPGDIICTHTTYNETTYQSYIYLSSSQIVACKNGTVSTVASNNSEVISFLVTLCAYDRFVVLRPSLVY